jgi:hypothetical protein
MGSGGAVILDEVMSRLQPAIELPSPKAEDELRILRYNLPAAPEALVPALDLVGQGGGAVGVLAADILAVGHGLGKGEIGGVTFVTTWG